MHQAALILHREKAAEHQAARDAFVRELRESDKDRWSYTEIAKATGLGRELVKAILKKPAPGE